MRVVWAPERVGEGRRFRIVIESAGAIACACPAELELMETVDKEAEHRLYFRAVRPGIAPIVLRGGGEEIALRVRVLAESEWDAPAVEGEIVLPRMWPLGDATAPGPEIELKTRHTIVPAGEIGGNAANPPACDALGWTDTDVWDLITPTDVPRWHFLNLDHGCPVHGLGIYHSDPYYPWIVDVLGHPWHIQCPVGGEWYPTNDYRGDDHSSGDFPDDGLGWERATDDGGVAKFGFLSYYLLRRIRFAYGVVAALANRFVATGEQEAARKIAILLAAFAREHRYLCRFPEHRFRRFEGTVEEPHYRPEKTATPGPRTTDRVEHLNMAGMDDYCINMPFHYVEVARAYDLVFDRIDGDGALIAFLRDRIPGIADGPSARAYIEKWLFRAGLQAGRDGSTASNLPEPQRGQIALVRALGRPECAAVVEETIHGRGEVGRMPVNYYYKDGAAYESTGGYNGHHVVALVPIVEGLRALRDLDPATYPAEKFDPIEEHERYRRILEWPLDVVVAQMSHPFIGDTGDLPNAKPLVPMPAMAMGDLLAIYESAVRSFPDDARFAAALAMLHRKDEAARRAAESGDVGKSGFYGGPPEGAIEPDPALFLPSRLLDGYGVGILESGSTENRRGLWIYYGDHPGHCHEQYLDIGLFAARRNLIRHMGYPFSWQHMGTWDGSWITHHTVKVAGGEAGEPWWRCGARMFHGADAGAGFQLVEAAGYGVTASRGEEGVEPLPGYAMRRTLALVDLPDGRFYAVDLFRAAGGRDHWWTFHGLMGGSYIEADGKLLPQEGGTVAGREVAYGAKTPPGVPASLAYLYRTRRGDVARWSATWEPADGEGLKVRATQVAPAEGELVVARGRSPHAPPDNPPYELDWVLRHRNGADPLVSEFVTVLEADGAPPVDRVDPVAIGPISGVRVEAAGAVHYVLRADAMDSPVAVGDGIAFQGRAGFVEIDGGGIVRATLVGEGTLAKDGTGIARGARDWRGTIVEIDAAGRQIVVEADSAPPESIAGAWIFVERAFDGVSDRDSFAYRVDDARAVGAGRWELRLNWSSLIGDGVVGEATATGFRAPGGMPLGASRAFYRGAYLHVGDRRVRLRDIRGHWIAGATVVVAPEDRAAAAEVFTPGTPFAVAEIGAGDRVVLRGWTEIRRDPGSGWHVASNGRPEIARA